MAARVQWPDGKENLSMACTVKMSDSRGIGRRLRAMHFIIDVTITSNASAVNNRDIESYKSKLQNAIIQMISITIKF